MKVTNYLSLIHNKNIGHNYTSRSNKLNQQKSHVICVLLTKKIKKKWSQCHKLIIQIHQKHERSQNILKSLNPDSTMSAGKLWL